MKRAEKLLSRMEDEADPAPIPNVLTYTSFLGGLSRCKERDLARRAEQVLDRMVRLNVQADMVAYTSVLNCWSKATSRRERELAASRAQRLLQEMERAYARSEYHLKPSLITYATVIRAIGNSMDYNAPKMAEDMLQHMYEVHESGLIANVKPTTSTYNAVLNALSRGKGNRRDRYARRAEELLEEMTRLAASGEVDVRPDVRTWAAVLRAWSYSGIDDAAENAQRVLEELERRYEEGSASFRPNYVCYTTVMGAWGSSKRTDALDKLETLLRKMEDGYEETQEADIRPNTISYVTAIDSYVRQDERNAAKRAQATVDRMTRLYAKGLGHVRPTRIIFNTLIHAWSKSSDRDAAKKAEMIFKWMEAQYQAGDDLVRPDQVSLCAVLNAWATQALHGGADRALQIFQHTKATPLAKRGFHLSISMVNIVIKAIARSGSEDSVEKVEEILSQLEEDYQSGRSSLRPDVATYSSVINCCAYYKYPAKKALALDVAMRTFDKVRHLPEEGPNNITFGTLFKAISCLMPPSDEREALVQELFDEVGWHDPPGVTLRKGL